MEKAERCIMRKFEKWLEKKKSDYRKKYGRLWDEVSYGEFDLREAWQSALESIEENTDLPNE